MSGEKEVAVAYFEALSRQPPGGAEENQPQNLWE
jgi:hypothetical protein